MFEQHAEADRNTGTRDGRGAADHDQPYSFGRTPRSGTSYPFSTRQYIRLLVLRGRIQDGDVTEGDIGYAA
jgi:hypothetical protein